MAAQPESARQTELPTTMQQEAQVPAPSPTGIPGQRHTQRPDRGPELRASSNQEAGNKTRDILKCKYKTTGAYVQLLPQFPHDRRPIDDVYTKVHIEMREGVAFATLQKGETANSTEYAKMFQSRTDKGNLIKRLIFFGEGGVGKSTIFNKIAYDLANETSEILNRFKLVFRLKMCALEQISDLVDSIFDQLLGEQSGVEKHELERFILDNSNEVLILLDGFDEMGTKALYPASFGSVLKAFNRQTYMECFICVLTRPSHLETLMSDKLVENPCIHVKIFGFSDDDVKEYIKKFFAEDSDSGNALIQTIDKSNGLRVFSNNPMLLVLMCCLWRESQQLPETTSRLFAQAVDHMFRTKRDSPISKKVGSKTVISIGKTALHGLTSPNQKLSFKANEFEPNALELALKAGILTKQSVIKNRESHRYIQFMHKSMQEYCAAKYLPIKHLSNFGFVKRCVCKVIPFTVFQSSFRQLCSKLEGVVSNEFLFRFCCGDNEKCMTDIVNLLDRKFNKDKSRYQSNVAQAIIRNCFF